MKITSKLVVLIITILAAPLPARSQEREQVELGVKGGANVTTVSVDGPDAFNPNAVLNWTLGGFFGFRLGERFAIGAELLYAELAVTTDDFGVEARFDSRGFHVPFPVRLDLGGRDRTHAFLTGGPMWTFLGRSVQSVAGIEEDLGNEIRDTDFSLFFGGGIRTPLSRGALSLEARYSRGLVDLDTSSEDVVKNKALLILLGYTF